MIINASVYNDILILYANMILSFNKNMENNNKNKLFREIKEKNIDDLGIFSGYASVFDIEDSSGDIIKFGAFKNIDRNIKLLWQHNANKPIGKILELIEECKGLYIKAQIILDLDAGKEAYILLKNNIIDGLSIGYMPLNFYYKDNIRIITEIKVVEISVVTFPANDKARIENIKQEKAINGLEERIFRKISRIHFQQISNK